MKKLPLEEKLESKQWSTLQWTIGILAFAAIVYGAFRFFEWAVK